MTSVMTKIDFTDLTKYRIIIQAATRAVLNITVTRGGVAQNLTGATIKFYAGLSTPITKIVGSGIVLTVPLLGQCSLTILETDTSSQNTDQNVDCECKVTLAGGGPELLFEGRLQVEKTLILTTI